jgi:hypothetical protein
MLWDAGVQHCVGNLRSKTSSTHHCGHHNGVLILPYAMCPADVDGLKPEQHTTPVRLPGGSMLKSKGGGIRCVVPYTMSATDAQSYAMDAIW